MVFSSISRTLFGPCWTRESGEGRGTPSSGWTALHGFDQDPRKYLLLLYVCISTIGTRLEDSSVRPLSGSVMFRVQPGSGEPIYQQLVRRVKHSVATGVLSAGAQLPTVRELAAELVINPNTVARAYRELERDGVLEGVRGRGTFVRTGQPLMGKAERRRRLAPALERLIAEGRTLGFEDTELVAALERVLGVTRTPAAEPS